MIRFGLPSQEGSGLKHIIHQPLAEIPCLPSQEGSGLKLYMYPYS